MNRITEAAALLELARKLRELAPKLDHRIARDDVLHLAERCEELVETAKVSAHHADVASDTTQEVSEPIQGSLKNLYAYWLAKRGLRIAPSRSAIQLDAVLRQDIVLVDVVGDPPRFRYSFCGTRLADYYGEDLTGRFLDEIDLGSVSVKMIGFLTTIVRECRPQVIRARYTKQRDRRRIEFERIALPLSEDGKAVNTILCAYTYRRPSLSTVGGSMLMPPA